MAFRIDEISSTINSMGVQKTSHFTANIFAPPLLKEFNGLINDVPLRINSINLPGVNIGTDVVKHKGFGLDERRPNAVGYEDISMTIIADARGKIHKGLHEWYEMIFPTNTDINNNKDIEYFEYPNNYYGGLEIYVYDATGNIHTTYTFIDPFPVNLGAIQMGWENVDSLILIPISFTYRSYKKNSTYQANNN